jgi:hypothetical protein
MNEREQLSAVCARLGASPAQAGVMADQLLKRAAQLSVERGIPREAALRYLLDLVSKGRNGEVPKNFVPPDSRPAGD